MRTVANGIELGANGKYFAKFITFKGMIGSEYVAGEAESAAVFKTEAEAIQGQERALDVLAKTGRFPNMCEVF